MSRAGWDQPQRMASWVVLNYFNAFCIAKLLRLVCDTAALRFKECVNPRLTATVFEVLSPAVLTADNNRPFEIGYVAYPMFGAVVVTAKVVVHGRLNRSILWPYGEQERK